MRGIEMEQFADRRDRCSKVLGQVRSNAGVFAVVAMALYLSGCGSHWTGANGAPIPQAVTIAGQPANQSVPLGQTATFSVVALGTAPISYQWGKNGSAISGATGDSYTTPAVTAADSADSFSVTVTNSLGSVASSAAQVIIGPRSPKAGDLRFQQVDAPSQAEDGVVGGIGSAIGNGEQWISFNATGTPLSIGATGGWAFSEKPLPAGQSGLAVGYQSYAYANFDSDLAALESPNSVITSLDLEPINYGIAWVQTTQAGGFNVKREVVAPDAVQSTVALDATQGRVVTAVSFDTSGHANVFSYGWQSDTATVYDTNVVSVTNEQDFAEAATNLASQGYIITAFGGDPTNGFLLVGTKVQGDTIPRPVMIATQSSPLSKAEEGYAPVAWMWLLNGNSDYGTTIFEK
ncbi:MAG: immunoglobulin domain-containing protein [Acidobacteriaceae bacterium]